MHERDVRVAISCDTCINEPMYAHMSTKQGALSFPSSTLPVFPVRMHNGGPSLQCGRYRAQATVINTHTALWPGLAESAGWPGRAVVALGQHYVPMEVLHRGQPWTQISHKQHAEGNARIPVTFDMTRNIEGIFSTTPR